MDPDKVPNLLTITDAQIERLRDEACACRDSHGNKPPVDSPDEHAGVFDCDVATYDICVTALEALDEEGFCARVKCAELLAKQ